MVKHTEEISTDIITEELEAFIKTMVSNGHVIKLKEEFQKKSLELNKFYKKKMDEGLDQGFTYESVP